MSLGDNVDAFQRWLTLLTLLSAGLAALLYLGHQAWRLFHALDTLQQIVSHELSPNSGTSMKDDVVAIAQNVGQLQADVAKLTRDKQLAHELLQLQLDTLHVELGKPVLDSRHRREEHDSEGS